jgi:hypothetical protein
MGISIKEQERGVDKYRELKKERKELKELIRFTGIKVSSSNAVGTDYIALGTSTPRYVVKKYLQLLIDLRDDLDRQITAMEEPEVEEPVTKTWVIDAGEDDFCEKYRNKKGEVILLEHCDHARSYTAVYPDGTRIPNLTRVLVLERINSGEWTPDPNAHIPTIKGVDEDEDELVGEYVTIGKAHVLVSKCEEGGYWVNKQYRCDASHIKGERRSKTWTKVEK